MSKNRIKSPPVLPTREAAERAMLDLVTAENIRRKLLAQRDAEVLKINDRCEAGISQCTEFISEKTQQLQQWAEANPDQFPKGRKSIDFDNGILGFRRGNPKVSLFSRAWKWATVLMELKKYSWTQGFIRTVEEIDKDKILAQYATSMDKPQTDGWFAKVGIKVVQEESFFIEPKLAEIPTRQTTEA